MPGEARQRPERLLLPPHPHHGQEKGGHAARGGGHSARERRDRLGFFPIGSSPARHARQTPAPGFGTGQLAEQRSVHANPPVLPALCSRPLPCPCPPVPPTNAGTPGPAPGLGPSATPARPPARPPAHALGILGGAAKGGVRQDHAPGGPHPLDARQQLRAEGRGAGGREGAWAGAAWPGSVRGGGRSAPWRCSECPLPNERTEPQPVEQQKQPRSTRALQEGLTGCRGKGLKSSSSARLITDLGLAAAGVRGRRAGGGENNG